MNLKIDASKIFDFSRVMAGAPEDLGREVAKELNEGATLGKNAARSNINSQSGRLAGSIQERQIASAGSLKASYSVFKTTSLPYVFQREKGGVIRAKNGGYLIFRGRNGGLVAVKQVSQKGSYYMKRSAEQIRPRVEHGIAGAVHRVIASLL